MRFFRFFRSPFFDLLAGFLVIGGLLLVAAITPTPDPEILQGMARAIDGDSLTLNGQELRLQGIDAPERYQICDRDGVDWACGTAARDQLRQWLRQPIRCEIEARDRFDRLLAHCRAGDIDINRRMVLDGWAVDFGGYPSEEMRALAARRGIWVSDFERPAQWRRLHKGP